MAEQVAEHPSGQTANPKGAKKARKTRRPLDAASPSSPMARAIRLVRTARQENLDATTTSAKNAAVPLTPLDRSIGDLLAAALVKDLLAFPEGPAT